MTAIYLWFNSFIYIFFTFVCAINYSKTSFSLGYEVLSNSGKSEYLTVYGGLQLGLAVFYAYLAKKTELHEIGLIFSIFLYLGIVIFRSSSFFLFSPLSSMTKVVACLEIFLLVASLILYYKDNS